MNYTDVDMPTRRLILILGDQLTLDNPALREFDPHHDRILMVEVSGESSYVWSHKARIALFLSAMRHFARRLRDQAFRVEYWALGEHAHETLASAWDAAIKQFKPQSLVVCEVGEYRLEQALYAIGKQHHLTLRYLEDTHFMCSRTAFLEWAKDYKTLRMEYFYRWMRKRFQLLMQDGQPIGGQWNYDADNRQSFAKGGPESIPERIHFGHDDITHDVFADVEAYFPEHPGSLLHFCWPVTREQALSLLQEFVEKKLAHFGPYQDAMWQFSANDSVQHHHPFFWHSLLSSSLNLKLLSPHEVIQAVLQAYHQHQIPLSSVEGFIRQILGWREFIRGLYWRDMPALAEENYFQHTRPLPTFYWTGQTHMNCLRQTIMQTLAWGYAHHIQRLMVTGLFGLLAEIQPSALEDWYLAIYVDAVEWVELPNTIGMALYANGGTFTSKPYVASGAYIKKMSNYCSHCRYKPEVKTGPQACPFTTLYWAFLIKHQTLLSANLRTSLMVKHVEKMSEDTKTSIVTFAKTRLQNIESL